LLIGAEAGGAEQQDNDRLSSLQKEQNEIITFLKQGEDTIKQKILKLAEILEERMERADPELPPSLTTNMISSYISKTFKENDIKSANYVHRCLPDKYKDTKQQRYILLVDGELEVRDNIEIIKTIGSNIRYLKENIHQITEHQDLAIVHEIADEMKKAVSSRAMDLGVILPGYERKDSHKTPTPPSEITDCSEAMQYGIDYFENTKQFFIKFPPPADKNALWAAGIVQLIKLFPDGNEKFSLLRLMWWSRIKYMIHQSKHGAAVKDEIMTMLCENCYDIKTGTEKQDCNAEMIRDYKSATGWRCGSCNGIVGHYRGLTREQVGDNKAPVITQCERFVKEFPGFVDMAESYHGGYMPYGHARKIDLGVELSSKA
jgi:hypothetical protein